MSIYQYWSFRDWLGDWFVLKKAANPHFSHRVVARLCKQKSPSFFRDITSGRRNITQDQIQVFLRLMELSEIEERYFHDLVISDQADSEEQRQAALDRISSAQRLYNATSLEGAQYQYLTNWYCPAIREMALRTDFQPNATWIVDNIFPPISVEQANDALALLQDLGLLTLTSNGVTVQDISITTPMQVTGMAVHRYHQQMLELAKGSIGDFEEDQRHVLGVTVSIPKNLRMAVKEELNQMAARLLDLCDGAEGDKDDTIQLGLYMFPLNRDGDPE